MQTINFQFFRRPSSWWQGVLALRMQVFVDELKVPVELEVDEYDQTALHLSAYICAQTGTTKGGVACARTLGTLRLQQQGDVVKLGRVAVHPDYRRQGMGSQMIQQAVRYCSPLSVTEIVLNAQTYITGFYRRQGFSERGEVFEDAGIPHIEMYWAG